MDTQWNLRIKDTTEKPKTFLKVPNIHLAIVLIYFQPLKRGQPLYEGQKGWSQHVLYSEVPLYSHVQENNNVQANLIGSILCM